LRNNREGWQLMSKVYYFVFTQGQYEEYDIQEICVCDHEVTPREYAVYMEKYESTLEEVFGRIPKIDLGTCYKPSDYNSKEHAEYCKWIEDNDPVKAFKELHGMKPLECVELYWRG